MKASETDLSIGREHEMAFPFQIMESFVGNPMQPDIYENWYAGCKVTEEDDGSEFGHDVHFTAHGDGKVIYKILSLVKMPGRYQDRVIFKRWLIDPDGNKYNNGEVRMLTKKSFCRDVTSRTPFRADYELENDDG